MADWRIPLGVHLADLKDKTAVQDISMHLVRNLPKVIPKAPPPKPEELTWIDKVILSPYVSRLVQKDALGTAKEGINNVKNFKKGLEYMNPIPYDNLVNEAVNRSISKGKR
ncbi:MAG: hypothetical protein LBC75_02610 [Fibromonadaceae bacterium]|jgi:hypothetical protein|nr:hypothetical protein [Fibromonadaceae bacterium]